MPSLIAILGFDSGPFNKGMDAAQAKARSGGKGIESSFGGLGKSLAGFASVGAIGAAIHSTVEYASKVHDLSLRLGISTDAVQQWDYALGQSGSSIDAAVPFFEKLGKARLRAMAGSEEDIAAFQKFGISMDVVKSGVNETAKAIAEVYHQGGDPQELIGALTLVGGKGAGALVAAFKEGLGAAMAEASLVSPESIDALERFGDAWSKLKKDGQAIFAELLVGIADLVVQTIDVARIGLDTAVGAFTGAYNALSKLGIADLLTPASTAAKLLNGAMEGAGEAGEKAVDRAGKNQSQRRIDAAVRQEKRDAALAKTKTGAGDDEEQLSKKEIALADKTAKETERLAAKEQADAAKEQAADAKAQADAIKETEKAQKEGAALGKHSVSSEQQLGMFFGNYASAGSATAPELAALNVQMQSEKHLAQIVKLLSGGSGDSGTSF